MKKKIYSKIKYDFIGPPIFDTRNIRFEQKPPENWSEELAQEYEVYLKDTESQQGNFKLKGTLRLVRNNATGKIEFYLSPLLDAYLNILTNNAVEQLMEFENVENGFYFIENYLDENKAYDYIQKRINFINRLNQ